MIIANSTIMLSSMRRYAELETRRESLKAWIGDQRPNFVLTSTSHDVAPSQAGAPAPRAASSGGGAALGGRVASLTQETSCYTEEAVASKAAGIVALQGDPPQAMALAKQVVDDLVPRWPSRGIGVNGSPNPSSRHIVQTLAKKASAAGMEDGGAGLTPELRIVKLLLEKLFGIKVKIISLPDAGPDAEGVSERAVPEGKVVNSSPHPNPPPSHGGGQGGGLEYLATLQQKDVGATYLGREKTPFVIKDIQNGLQGQVVASGIYLNEDGSAGSVQQVNLVG